MTVYPFDLDSDRTIPRIDDNLSELGTEVINLLREAMFAVQGELGINPSGSLDSLNDFLNVSFNENGTIKASALSSVGLVTLPITNAQVGTNAGIQEFKLALDYSTVDLHTLIVANQTLINSLNTFTNNINANLLTHIAGGELLADGTTPGRHVGSHIDINAVPSDSRDVSYVWGGLFDKDNNPRTATTVAEALDQISTELVTHQNITSSNPAAHPATAISVDGSNFTEISPEVADVQEALDAIDDLEVVNLGTHRATMHSNGVPRTARSLNCSGPDGYNRNVVPATPVVAHVAHGGSSPVDDSANGDDIIKFEPTNTDFIFDSQFSKVKPGDIVRINYGNGIEAAFEVESLRFIPGTDWTVRINGSNFVDTDGYSAFARIDRPLFDTETFSVLAAGNANNNVDTSVPPSAILAHPRSASALGIGFNPDKLDSTHYKLYLNLYPTGDPQDRVIQLPAIDVTGNAGATPGMYTLSSVVDATNDSLRSAGFNYRFHAFSHDGEFGITLSDAINCASFSIVNGTISSAQIVTGSFTENVVADASDADGTDPLGFGINAASVASPDFVTTFASAEEALLATNVIVPKKRRNFAVNGIRRDSFAQTYLATLDENNDGYWTSSIEDSVLVGGTTVKTTYRVPLDLRPAGLKPGKTITVQPAFDFSDPSYKDSDYGRFVIDSVFFDDCGTPTASTEITVLNSIHSTGLAIGTFAPIGEEALLYFSEDSVSFNDFNVSDATSPGNDFIRFHEIYIDDTGNSFSHERARMAEQTASGSALGTNRFHIRDVSPKLRGYIDDSSVGPDRYVRFYVLSYSSFSGEYDGYLGKRDPSTDNVTRMGPIVRGRKNVVTRFYDETHIDYIDIEFQELEGTGNPGTPVLSSSTPQFVDIQVYPSLQLDDEFFLLSKCELKKDASNFIKVQGIKEAREFGTVSEKNLTTSAIEFIQAGDRHLHSNGIIRGFGFTNVDPTNDKKLFFDGGVALVNGALSMVNNTSIIIPEIQLEGDSLPETYEWAICVNEHNQLDAILITNFRDQFFATLPGDANAFYVQSNTFAELISERKDLTPIAVVTVTIASVTIDSINDVRRFVLDETLNIPFTWVDSTNDNGFVGHFHSFEALTTWINNYGDRNFINVLADSAANKAVIKVKGVHYINSTVDLTDLNFPVIFEGDNASFAIEAGIGFILNSNVSFRDLTFNYAPSSGGPDFINSGAGALYRSVAEGEILSNVLVENCTFVGRLEGRRPPFINIEVDGDSVVNNLVIDNNVFNDDLIVTDNRYTAAVAIIDVNPNGTVVEASAIYDSKITNNTCNRSQGIHITSQFSNTGDIIGPGIHTFGVEIAGNSCGVIGFIVTTDKNVNTTAPFDDEFIGKDRTLSLNIHDNSCMLITHSSETGHVWNTNAATLDTTLPPLGNVKVYNNTCSWILLSSVRNQSDIEDSSLIISENQLNASSPLVLEQWNAGGGAFAALPNAAIAVTFDIALSSTSLGNAQIVNNKISSSTLSVSAIDATFYYDIGISVFNTCLISGNVIDGISTGFGTFGGTGIAVGAATTAEALVTNNKIFRRSNTIANYVLVTGVATNSGMVVDNTFDSSTIDGSSTTVISTSGDISNWILERNKNQTVTKVIHPGYEGRWFADDSFTETPSTGLFPTTPGDISSIVTSATDAITGGGSSGAVIFTYATSGDASFAWRVRLHNLIPKDVNIDEISVSLASDSSTAWDVAGPGTQSKVKLQHIINTSAVPIGSGTTVDDEAEQLLDTTSATVTLPSGSGTLARNDEINRGQISVLVIADNTDGSNEHNVRISGISVTYRW